MKYRLNKFTFLVKLVNVKPYYKIANNFSYVELTWEFMEGPWKGTQSRYILQDRSDTESKYFKICKALGGEWDNIYNLVGRFCTITMVPTVFKDVDNFEVFKRVGNK